MDYKVKLIQLLNSKELTKEEEERLCKIFPELAESEDERIRKDLILYLRSILSNKKYGDKFIEDWIAWLEKQGEQKQEWSEKDNDMLLDIDACIVKLPIFFEKMEVNGKDVLTSDFISKAREFLKSLKDRVQPKQEWSDDDEKHIRSILSRLDTTFKDVFTDSPFTISEDIDWLESLPSLSHWKPSEEQMRVIDKTINFIICHDDIGSEYLCNKLNELKQQLKG